MRYRHKDDSQFDRSFKKLAIAIGKLAPDQGRVARQHARLKVHAAIRSLRSAMDATFPKVEKPKPVRVGRPAKTTLPFNRAWDFRAAQVFVRLAAESFGCPVPKIHVHEGSRHNDYRAGEVYYANAWTDRQKWMEVCTHFAAGSVRTNRVARNSGFTRRVGLSEVIDLWRRFWSEQIPTTDIQLAADQLDVIERDAKRRATARKAIESRKRDDLRRASAHH